MIWLSLAIGILGVAFGVLYRKYRRTREQAWLYAALVVMLVDVELRKEVTRRQMRERDRSP